ncbi:MAG TPA: outer membrane beta-barrel protein, partial [Gemmatimonadales bacterium]|nr:outer membrane beta-barrel protein [Gemmatimonadales bacterium]
MHRPVVLALLIVLAAPPLAAQTTWELTPTIGYRYGGTVNSETGKFAANDGLAWGGTIGYRVKSDGLVEFVYSRQDTDILFDPDTAAEVTIGEAAIEYFQLGGALEFGHNEKTKPFFALTVGATHFSPQSSALGDDWRFSFGGALGVKTYLSRHFGLRAQARIW